MNILFFMVPVALLLSLSFVGAFVWAARSGQFDDTLTPAHRMLVDDKKEKEHP